MLLDEMKELFTDEEQSGIKQAVAYLNRKQFFHAETSGQNAVRKALSTMRTRRFIDQAFAILGYQFLHDEVQGWYGIIPEDGLHQSRTMTQLDTFVLLVAARSYNAGFSDGWVDGRGNVELSFNDFCDTVQSYATPANLDIRVGQIRASIATLGFVNVVHLGEKVEASGDMPLTIRPFITRLLPANVTARLENFIQLRNAANPEDVTATGDEPADAAPELALEN